jgi:hypothetical protein
VLLALRRRLDAMPASANSEAQSRLIGELEKLLESVQSLIGRLRE